MMIGNISAILTKSVVKKLRMVVVKDMVGDPNMEGAKNVALAVAKRNIVAVGAMVGLKRADMEVDVRKVAIREAETMRMSTEAMGAAVMKESPTVAVADMAGVATSH